MTNEQLIAKAKEQLKYSYSPYSQIKVAAALLTENGTIFLGSNVENSSYGATVCAEQVAVFKAISEGEMNFTDIAIVSNIEKITPCGICRQVLNEFAPDINIITEMPNKELNVTKLTELFPNAFTINL